MDNDYTTIKVDMLTHERLYRLKIRSRADSLNECIRMLIKFYSNNHKEVK